MARFKKKLGSSKTSGPAAKAKSSAAGAPSEPVAGTAGARRGSSDDTRAPSPPKKRFRTAEDASGVPAAPKKKNLAEAGKDKAPGEAPKEKAPAEKRPEAARPAEPRSRAAPGSTPSGELPIGDPWRPRVEALPGRPLNTMDRVASNPLAVAAVAKCYALPLDMAAHAKLDDEHLLIRSLQASLLVSVYL